jgi:hypothetical protein
MEIQFGHAANIENEDFVRSPERLKIALWMTDIPENVPAGPHFRQVNPAAVPRQPVGNRTT